MAPRAPAIHRGCQGGVSASCGGRPTGSSRLARSDHGRDRSAGRCCGAGTELVRRGDGSGGCQTLGRPGSGGSRSAGFGGREASMAHLGSEKCIEKHDESTCRTPHRPPAPVARRLFGTAAALTLRLYIQLRPKRLEPQRNSTIRCYNPAKQAYQLYIL